MCTGISIAWGELPQELIERFALQRLMHEHGGEREVRFLYRLQPRCLPVWHEGRLRIVRWGSTRLQSRVLPATAWTWQSTVDAGGWAAAEAQLVDIPATMGFENGIWYRIRQGIRGLLVEDEWGCPVIYMICEPASHYYQVMTRSRRMPVLIQERI